MGLMWQKNTAKKSQPCLPEVNCRRHYSGTIAHVLTGCSQAQLEPYNWVLIGASAPVFERRLVISPTPHESRPARIALGRC